MENFCENCNKQFKNKTTFNTHKKTSVKCSTGGVSISPKTFECEYCKKILSTKQMLAYHVNSFHKKENNTDSIILKFKEEFEKEKDNLQSQTTNTITKLHNEYYNYFRILQNDNQVTILELNKQNIESLKEEHNKLITFLKEEYQQHILNLRQEYENSIKLNQNNLNSFQEYIYNNTSNITEIHEELKKIKNLFNIKV
jgi:hypothetical protein